MNLAVARSRLSRHVTESLSSENLFPDAISAVAEETENCWLETRTKGPKRHNFLTKEDYENQASPQSAFDTFGLGETRGERDQQFREQQRRGEEIRGSRSCLAATRTCSSARTGKDGRKHARGSQTSKCTANKIRVSQDPGVACNIRPQILRLERLVGRQQCEGFGSGQTSHGVHELAFFRLPPGLERRENCWPASSSSSQLFRSWREIDWLEASEPSKDGERRLRVFRDDRSWQQSGALWPWTCAGSWYAGGCAHPGHVRSLSPTRGNAVTQTPRVSCTDVGGVQSWVILLFPEAGTASSKTGEADDTISLDSKRCLWMEQVFERPKQRQPQDKVLLNLHCAEYLLLLRRAAANLQVDMVPCQGRHSGASVDRAENLRTLQSIQESRTMEISQVCAPPQEKRTCQPKLVRARSIDASIATTSCPQCCFMVTPLRHRLDCSVFCDRSLQCEHRFATVFLEQRCTVCKTRSFFW